MVLTILLIGMIISIYDNTFYSIKNIMNLFRQTSILGITALGLTFIMRSGHYDFSLGAVTGLCAVASAVILFNGMNIFAALIGVCLIGLFVGACNGILVAIVGFSDYLVTFAAMFIVNGLDILLAKGGHGVTLLKKDVPALVTIGYGNFFGIPILIWVLMAFVITSYIISERSKWGIEIRAIGKNPVAAKFAGINVPKNVLLTYIYAGLLYGIAGFLLSSRLISVPSLGGEPYFMCSYAVVFLGSIMQKGEFNVIGTVLGSLLMTMLQSGFSRLGIPFYYQTIMMALVIVFSIVISLRLTKIRQKANA